MQAEITQTQRLLLQEVERQYERRKDMYEQSGGKLEAMQGNLICYLPYDMLREAFAGSVPKVIKE